MNGRLLAGLLCIALGAAFAPSGAYAQTVPPTSGPAEHGSPGWYLLGPGGVRVTDWSPPVNDSTSLRTAGDGGGGRCRNSTVCGSRLGSNRATARVTWEQTMGYEYTYPFSLPIDQGGATAVALDSQGYVWALQRTPVGSPQLFKFDPEGRLVLEVGPELYGRHQERTHGMAVDSEDNVWILDQTGATATKLGPDGRHLMTIGVPGRPGDWDDTQGQRLLWQPMHIAFAPNGDIYIAQGHGNESPNDVGSTDPTNNLGAARILRLDRDGRFIQQWFGDWFGPGRFESAHGLAIDPSNGDVWIGDREQYRIVIYSSDGLFLRTIQMRNLVCAIQFDSSGEPWIATGTDGQFLKIDRSGKVLSAVGRGSGREEGQFSEAPYFVFDEANNIYTGDTGAARITKFVAPR